MAQKVFLNPKIDYGFKIVFGHQDRTKPLISFLNEVLFNGKKMIHTINILNPYLPGNVESIKDTYVDVQAQLVDGTIIIIEMQAILRPEFFKRVLFNTAKKYGSQLESGEFYGKLKPVISLVIGNFAFQEERPELLSYFELKERESHIHYPSHADFQIVVVELEKFNLELEEVHSVFDMWLYFLRHADELQEVPEKMAKIKEIASAFKAAKLANLKADEQIELEKREKYALAEEANLAWAREEAFEIGLEEGIEQGIEKVVLRMLVRGNLTHAEIAAEVGLSLSEIEQIDKARHNG